MDPIKKKKLIRYWHHLELTIIVGISLSISIQLFIASFANANTNLLINAGILPNSNMTSIPISAELTDGVVTLVGNGDFQEGIALADKKLRVQGFTQTNTWTADLDKDFLTLKDSSQIDGFRVLTSIDNEQEVIIPDNESEQEGIERNESTDQSQANVFAADETTDDTAEAVTEEVKGLIKEDDPEQSIPVDKIYIYPSLDSETNAPIEPETAIDDESANFSVVSEKSCNDSENLNHYQFSEEFKTDDFGMELSSSSKVLIEGQTACVAETKIKIEKIVIEIPEGTPAGKYGATLSLVAVDGNE